MAPTTSGTADPEEEIRITKPEAEEEPEGSKSPKSRPLRSRESEEELEARPGTAHAKT